MNIPHGVSDEAADALVELAFLALPSMDGKELTALLSAVLRIIAREVRRARAEERQRQRERLRPHPQ
jgi:hypothetical protein